MNSPGVALLVELLKAISRLALPAAEQVAELHRRGLLPNVDELALEFDDCVVLVPQFVASGWLSDTDASAIAALDECLAGMSGPERSGLWTQRALEESPEWEEVRYLARNVLAG